MRSEFLTHECSAGQRCQADQRQLLCWIQQTPWSEMVENINSHTERQTHNCGRIPINCRGEQEEDWAAMWIPVYCRRREGFGWGRREWCWSHRKALPNRSKSGNHPLRPQCRRFLQVRGQFEGWCWSILNNQSEVRQQLPNVRPMEWSVRTDLKR